VLLLIVTLGFGLAIGDLSRLVDEAARDRFRLHFLLGLSAALFVVFVHSLVVVYFIGTSRWCREVVDTYRLDRSFIDRSARLKRKAFPWALLGMLGIVAVIALGAAADPATGRTDTAGWSVYHFVAALCFVAFVLWSYFSEWNLIHANQQIIGEVMQEVARVRRERGLEA